MGSYKEIEGNLINLALQGEFDAIAHGCNCQVTMAAGIANQIAKMFPAVPHADKLYDNKFTDRRDKLGTTDSITIESFDMMQHKFSFDIINGYTQFYPGRDLDYDALTLSLMKINDKYRGKKIGLPQIGCGIAGGNWDIVKQHIQTQLKDCDVTVVIFK